MKLCSSNNHYTIDCTSFGVIILFPLTSTSFFSVNIFMFLSSFHFNVFVFGDCKVHHNDWLIYETGETDKPVGLYYNFSIPNNLTQMVHFTAQICDCDSHVPFLLDFFHLSLVFAQQRLFLCREILIIFLSQFLMTSFQTQQGMSFSPYSLLTILVLIGMVFIIILWISHEQISLNSVLLQLLLYFVSRSRKLMYISLMISIRSSLTLLHVFQLLV